MDRKAGMVDTEKHQSEYLICVSQRLALCLVWFLSSHEIIIISVLHQSFSSVLMYADCNRSMGAICSPV